MKKSDLISHRGLLPEDEHFIYATFLKGLRYGNSVFEMIDQEIYFQNYRKIIAALLKTHDIKIACLKDDPGVIIGYCIYKESRVDWMHIKENWRKMGIARDLLPENFRSVSHLSDLASKILKKYPQIIFNPFL